MNEQVTEKTYPIQDIWVVKQLILGIIFGFIFALYGVVRIERTFNLAWIMIITILVAVFCLFVTYFSKINFHYAFGEKFITFRQGIISKKQRDLPYGVIQTIFVKQDLLDRLLGIATVTIENASFGAGSLDVAPKKFLGMPTSNTRRQRYEILGFSGNKVNILGLAQVHAEQLKTSLLAKIKENPIEDNQSGL